MLTDRIDGEPGMQGGKTQPFLPILISCFYIYVLYLVYPQHKSEWLWAARNFRRRVLLTMGGGGAGAIYSFHSLYG